MKSKLLINLLFLGLFFGTGVFADTSGYAWGENTGWVNFGTAEGNVQVTDSAVTGYAWSDNYGWINLAPSASGVENDGSGNLSGYAWGENTGWVNFSGVTINSSGEFTGTATISEGPGGTINFSCSGALCPVTTDWRVESSQGSGSTSGGGGGTPISYADTTPPPAIIITYIKETYSVNEDVIIKGKGEPGTIAIFKWENKYGQAPIGSDGFFAANFGKFAENAYDMNVIPKDMADNEGPWTNAKFSVAKPQSIIDQIIDIVSPIFEPEVPELPIVEEKPKPVFGEKWNLLPEKPLNEFTFAPLPENIKMLAQKFPQMEKTFQDTNVQKITDVIRLKNSNLTLPSMTRALGFTLPRGVPLAQLTSTYKNKIPSEILFAKTGAGLIDLNVALSINNQGQAQQAIKMPLNKPLQLIVKTDTKVKKITGYLIFKSKKPRESSYQVPRSAFTASLMMANPPNEIPEIGEKISGIEMVLLEFDFQDTGQNVYSATIQTPLVEGEYEIITVIDYGDMAPEKKEIKMLTVIDPEGYVYEKDGDKETRVNGAVVSLFWLNPESKQYELWPAGDYEQENPQVTDVRGSYSFLVPEGNYYIKVDAPGYTGYDGKPFEVKEGSGVHINIELKGRYWWLNAFDWKTIALILVALMLAYNFYKDKKRAWMSQIQEQSKLPS